MKLGNNVYDVLPSNPLEREVLEHMQWPEAAGYPPGQHLFDALDLITDRLYCVKEACRFLRRCSKPLIANQETAATIDRIANDYGITVGCVRSYEMQELNSKIGRLFPLGSESGKIPAAEFGGELLTEEEYAARVLEKIPTVEYSGSGEVKEAIRKMQDEVRMLEHMKYSVLAFIIACGEYESGIHITYGIDVAGEVIWKYVTNLATGTRYYMPLDERIADVLNCCPDKISWFVWEGASVDYCYCRFPYHPKAAVEGLREYLEKYISITESDKKISSYAEWITTCLHCAELKNYIAMIRNRNRREVPVTDEITVG